MTSTFLVDFNGANDTGEKDSTAIAPVIAGERVTAAVLGRPSEILRTRTETLRGLVENGLYRADADMKWAISGTGGAAVVPAVTHWNVANSGSFITDSTIRVLPLNGPAADMVEEQTYTIGADCQVLLETTRKDYDATSANATVVVWEEAALGVGVFCTVISSGLPTAHILTIKIRDDSTPERTDYGHVKAAFVAAEAPGGALEDVGLTYTAAGVGADATLVTLPTLVESFGVEVLPEDEDPAVPEVATYKFRGTYTKEYHDIPAGTFATFFALPKVLADGDTLMVKFDDLEARRSNNGNINSNWLCLASEHPEEIPMAIPIVKRVGGDLYWLDGTVVLGPTSGVPIYFGEHQKTVNRITGYAQIGGMIGAITSTSPAPLTVAPFYNDTIYPAAGVLQTVLQTLADEVNKKGDLNKSESVLKPWTFQSASTAAWGVRFYNNNTDFSGRTFAAVQVTVIPTGTSSATMLSLFDGTIDLTADVEGADRWPRTLNTTVIEESNTAALTTNIADTGSPNDVYSSTLRLFKTRGGSETPVGELLGTLSFAGVNGLIDEDLAVSIKGFRSEDGGVAGQFTGLMELKTYAVGTNPTFIMDGGARTAAIDMGSSYLKLAPNSVLLLPQADPGGGAFTYGLSLTNTSFGLLGGYGVLSYANTGTGTTREFQLSNSYSSLSMLVTTGGTKQLDMVCLGDNKLSMSTNSSGYPIALLQNCATTFLQLGTGAGADASEFVKLQSSSTAYMQIGIGTANNGFARLQANAGTYLQLGYAGSGDTSSVLLTTTLDGTRIYKLDMGATDETLLRLACSSFTYLELKYHPTDPYIHLYNTSTSALQLESHNLALRITNVTYLYMDEEDVEVMPGSVVTHQRANLKASDTTYLTLDATSATTAGTGEVNLFAGAYTRLTMTAEDQYYGTIGIYGGNNHSDFDSNTYKSMVVVKSVNSAVGNPDGGVGLRYGDISFWIDVDGIHYTTGSAPDAIAFANTPAWLNVL